MKSKTEELKKEIEELDKEMTKSYNTCIKSAIDKRERNIWKHRKEGWELAMEFINKLLKRN